MAVAAPVAAASPASAPAPAAPAARLHEQAKAPKFLARHDKPLWSELSPARRAALEPLHAEWDRMEGIRKKKWLEVADHFITLNPDEQQRMHARMRQWASLTPAQRKLARHNYTRAQKISPGSKASDWMRYQKLPHEEKKKLAERAVTKAAAAPRADAPRAAARTSQTPVGAAAPASTTLTKPANPAPPASNGK